MANNNLIKINDEWTQVHKAYQKVNGEWEPLPEAATPFTGTTMTVKNIEYLKPEMADSTFLLINSLTDIQTGNGYSGKIISNNGVTETLYVPKNSKFKKSLYFDGVSNYITFTNYDFAANDFTIEWWERPTSLTAGTRFMSTFGTAGGTECGAMFGWWCTSDLVPEIKWTSGDNYTTYKWNIIGHGVSAGNMDTSSWHHMVYMRSGSNLYIIKDGDVINTVSVGTNEMGCNLNLPMGFGLRGSDTPNSTYYKGFLCGIRLSKSAIYSIGTKQEVIPPSGNNYSYAGNISRLPEGYTELEYIESGGVQYIDTGIIANQNTRIDIDTMPMSVVNANSGVGFIPYGAGASYNSRAFECYSNGNRYEFNYSNTYIELGTARIYERMKISQSQGFIYINDELVHTIVGQSDFTTPYTIYLFAIHRGSPIIGQTRIYSCQIYDGDTLIKDFIPCLNASNEPGMYDTVNNQFHANRGTGRFIEGPRKISLPPGYVRLEYIESNGTQYIDTGIAHNDSQKFLLRTQVSYTTNTPTHQIMGFNGHAGNGIGTYTSGWWECSGFPTVTAGTQFYLEWYVHGTSWFRQVNNSSLSGTRSTTNFTHNMYLFASIEALTSMVPAYYCSCKMYYSKIFVDNILMREYIPCINPDGVAGLYDIVSKTFFGNNGTGTFRVGPIYAPNMQGCKELEYVTLNGSQYIDTKIVAAHPVTVTAKIETDNAVSSADQILIGTIQSSAHNIPIYLFQGKWYIFAGSTGLNSTDTSLMQNNTMYHLTSTIENGNMILYRNGAKMVSGTYSGSGPTSYTLYLGAYNNSGAASHYFKGKLYKCSIAQNGIMVRNYIPVIDINQEVVGLYDTISQLTYHGRESGANTGLFGAGPILIQ